ncbi:MAG: MBL fold metallo-hydrolase [Geminicoccaceae bacterium]
MRVTVLGCGTSAGVPQIGCDCAVCRSPDPRNKRLRCSILVETQGQKILFDTGPDLRRQCLDAGISRLDALVFTHAHADHLHGLDDIRAINNVIGRPLPAHAHADVLQRIQERFPYAFGGGQDGRGGFWRPEIQPRPFTGDGPFTIGPALLLPLAHGHGRSRVWGFRIGKFAYSTDADRLDEAYLEALAGIEVWLVDALRDKPHPSHSHLHRTLEWIARVRPKQAWLTHMNHEVDYATWQARLPEGVAPAHDGLVIELED